MSDDPCKKLEDEYLAALEAYEDADNYALSFGSTKTVDQIYNSSPVDGDAMFQAYESRDLARERYEKAEAAYRDCQKQYQKKK